MSDYDVTIHDQGDLARIAELEAWQREMVEKAANKSLDGYRELGQMAADAETRAEQAEAALAERDERIRRIHKILSEATLVWDNRLSDDDLDVLGLIGKWATPRARAEEGSRDAE